MLRENRVYVIRVVAFRTFVGRLGGTYVEFVFKRVARCGFLAFGFRLLAGKAEAFKAPRLPDFRLYADLRYLR